MGVWTTIRNLDKGLYRQAKAMAHLEGKTIAVWLAEAIREKLSKTGGFNFTYPLHCALHKLEKIVSEFKSRIT